VTSVSGDAGSATGFEGAGSRTATGSLTVTSEGSSSAHTHTTPAVSTLQPSVTVYIWKRTE